MLRFLSGLLLLSSCSLGVVKSGGERSYVFDANSEYSQENLKELAPQIVTTLSRDPQKGKLADLFSKQQPPIQRVGILVFETILQPTRGGLANHDKVFLSESGKQLMTEEMLSIWEQGLPILGEGIEYVSVNKIKNVKAFKEDGSDVEDFIKSKRFAMAPDDIFYLEAGKNTATATVLNPRGMRDLSLALVPAGELMAGPKFSEHAKHTLNEVAKSLKLDAMFIILNRIHWTAAHTDKHSGEIIPEEVVIKIEASTLIPLSEYRKRMNNLGESRDIPNTTIAYRSYEVTLKFPVSISVEKELQSFETIEKELLTPTLKTYNDLSQMLQMRLVEDIKLTHK
ncbi:MAG: hypothetical protein H0V66_10620 [Bdellovibrionales bacterium]|nr:hypothetical protein [Bdellovibrionales bacterium]